MKLKLGCAPYVEGSTVGGGTLVSPVNGKEAGARSLFTPYFKLSVP